MAPLATDLVAFSPELVLLAGIVLVLVTELFFARGPSTFLGLLSVGGAVAVALFRTPTASSFFAGLLVDDAMGRLIFALFCATAAATLLLGGRGAEPREARRDEAEWVALVLLATVAMSVLARATDLLTVFLGLETLSISSYLLVALGRKRRAASEAALKYVIYGGVASGVMLYGMSLLYGMAGSSQLAVIGAAIGRAPTLGLLGVVLCIAGLGYKVAAVPFHMWAPDVYEGAPAPVAALLSVGSKAAGLMALLRFVLCAAPSTIDGAASAWAPLWPLIAVATMTFGNLAALGQRNLQRLLAYSSIAQAGYLLTGLCAGTLGASAMLLYLTAYLFMNLGIFAVVSAVDAASIGGDLLDYSGLGRRAPALGIAAAFFLFSLVGLPPFAGFFGKWALISALLADESRRGLDGASSMSGALALAIVLNSVLSLAYYTRILRVMFFETPTVETPIPLRAFGAGRIAVLSLCAAGTLLFFLVAGPLGEETERATTTLMGR